MQLVLLYFLLTEELVDDMLCHVQALGLKAELAVHIDYPLKKKGSRCVSDFRLNFRNVIWINHEFAFFAFHVFKVVLWVLCYRLWILDFLPINLRHLKHFRLKIILDSLLVQFLYPFSMTQSLGTFLLLLVLACRSLHSFIASIFGHIYRLLWISWSHGPMLIYLHWSISLPTCGLVLYCVRILVGWIPAKNRV